MPNPFLHERVNLLQSPGHLRTVDLVIGGGVLREKHVVFGGRTIAAALHNQDRSVLQFAHVGNFTGIELRRDILDVGVVQAGLERSLVLLVLVPAGRRGPWARRRKQFA